jgi:alkanesulfonate monooxygenase SsuD/methylene tetrahydromethanopterin reductase-like flavin-dependent oxidoreductase (luciferase family)
LPLLASGANHVFAVPAEMRALPEPVAAKVRELRAAYDYGAHGLPGPANPNARLVDRLGLRDVLAERFALAGPPERVAAGLRELAGLGVGGVVVPAVGLDPDALIRRLGEEVLPMLAARPRP